VATSAEILARVRAEIGDLGEGFLKSFEGGHTEYEVGVRNIDGASVLVRTVVEGVSTPIDPEDYMLDLRTGLLILVEAPPAAAKLVVSGTAYPMFADSELERCVTTAVRQHCHGRTIQTRYREEGTGFIRIRREPITLENLPEVEIDAVAILATIEALWMIVTDASTDINVNTAEGTMLNRGQRYAQVMQMIDALTDRYKKLCQQLNIGLYRVEQSRLRRVSYMTGRLVPVFVPREYDEYGLPIREIPPRDAPNEDTSGIPSPVWGGFGY
jgi:hypothetical protein